MQWELVSVLLVAVASSSLGAPSNGLNTEDDPFRADINTFLAQVVHVVVTLIHISTYLLAGSYIYPL